MMPSVVKNSFLSLLFPVPSGSSGRFGDPVGDGSSVVDGIAAGENTARANSKHAHVAVKF